VIQRLNFFDIYGYLIPGVVLLALAFPLFSSTWHMGWGEAVVGLILAYVIGHLLHGLARIFFSFNRNGRAPSDYLLDQDNQELRPSEKLKLKEKYAPQGFFIDDENKDIRSYARVATFFACRRFLVAKDVAGYIEQFEGMYSLTRNAAMSTLLGSALYFGIACSSLWRANVIWDNHAMVIVSSLLVLLTGISTLVNQKLFEQKKKTALWAWLAIGSIFLVVFLVGVGAAKKPGFFLDASSAWVAWLIGASCLSATIQLYVRFRDFALDFSRAVYRDYLDQQ